MAQRPGSGLARPHPHPHPRVVQREPRAPDPVLAHPVRTHRSRHQQHRVRADSACHRPATDQPQTRPAMAAIVGAPRPAARPRPRVCVLCMCVWALLAAAPSLSSGGSPPGARGLRQQQRRLDPDLGAFTVSGHSSGGSMASQHFVAFSDVVTVRTALAVGRAGVHTASTLPSRLPCTCLALTRRARASRFVCATVVCRELAHHALERQCCMLHALRPLACFLPLPLEFFFSSLCPL